MKKQIRLKRKLLNVNKYGLISSFMLALLLFLPRIPLAIVFESSNGFRMDVRLWLPLDLYFSNGIRFYSIGIIDNYWSLLIWSDYNGGILLLILFWLLPLVALIFTFIFGVYISKSGIKYYKLSLVIMAIQNLSILFFPTVFGHFYMFPVYFFNELPLILSYGAYLSFLCTMFLYAGLKQYLIMEED